MMEVALLALMSVVSLWLQCAITESNDLDVAEICSNQSRLLASCYETDYCSPCGTISQLRVAKH
jgi:hypothetical protein